MFSKVFSMSRQQLLKITGRATAVNEPERLNAFKYLSWVIPSPFFLTNMSSNENTCLGRGMKFFSARYDGDILITS